MNSIEGRTSSVPTWIPLTGFSLGIFLMLVNGDSADKGMIYGSITATFLFLSMTANILADKLHEFKNPLIITSVLFTGFLFVGYVITVMFLVASMTDAVQGQKPTFWFGGILGLASSLLMILGAVSKMKKGI